MITYPTAVSFFWDQLPKRWHNMKHFTWLGANKNIAQVSPEIIIYPDVCLQVNVWHYQN